MEIEKFCYFLRSFERLNARQQKALIQHGSYNECRALGSLIGDIRKGHLFRDLPNQLVTATMRRKQKFLDGLWKSSRSGSIDKKILLENLHYLRNIVSALNKRCEWIDSALLPYATIFCKKAPKSKSGHEKKRKAAAGENSDFSGDPHQPQQQQIIVSNIPSQPLPPKADVPTAAPDLPVASRHGMGNYTEMSENIWQFGLIP